MRAVIVAHGDADDADRALCAGAGLLVAADGGSRTLERWGLVPNVLVGDLDSLGRRRAERLATRSVEVIAYAAAKDESDTELAVRLALDRGATEITLLGALGARIDHSLANVMLLADAAYRDVALRAARGSTVIRALHGGSRLAIDRPAGTIVTLLPVAGDAQGVRTGGLRYPLDGETLAFGRSRGLSNVVVSSPASVSLASGVLLVIETETEE